jgi:hypothetical protein
MNSQICCLSRCLKPRMNGVLVVATYVLWTEQYGAQAPHPFTSAENQPQVAASMSGRLRSTSVSVYDGSTLLGAPST